MDVTDGGMVTDVSSVPWNAWLPIDCTLLPTVTVKRAEQPLYAWSPMAVTESGTTTVGWHWDHGGGGGGFGGGGFGGGCVGGARGT